MAASIVVSSVSSTTSHYLRIPAYEELSYTWGIPENPREITIDGVDVPVTENLFQALLHLRSRGHPRILWIDAICINQGSVLERNEQIKLMGMIYAKAQRVVVWLGVEADYSSVAVDLARELCDKRHDGDGLINILRLPGATDRFKALWYLLYRDYWNRIWVVQETFFARETLVQCGPACISWKDLCYAQNAIKESNFTDYEGIEVLKDPDSAATLVWGGPLSLAPQDPDLPIDSDNKITLQSVLHWHKSKDATDARDKVYGILNMVEKSEAALIEVDYQQTVAQVYTAAVRAIIQTTQTQDKSEPPLSGHPPIPATLAWHTHSY